MDYYREILRKLTNHIGITHAFQFYNRKDMMFKVSSTQKS